MEPAPDRETGAPRRRIVDSRGRQLIGIWNPREYESDEELAEAMNAALQQFLAEREEREDD